VTQKGKDLVSFFVLNGLLLLGGGIATWGFRRSQAIVEVSDNPTPLGYTKSLVLFLLPCVVFGFWLMKYLKSPMRHKAFWLTISILVPSGLLLDIFFGLEFFTFRNAGSVLGSISSWFTLWAYDFHNRGWVKFIPIEEALFYLLGFLAILLTYIWSDEVIFPGHKVSGS